MLDRIEVHTVNEEIRIQFPIELNPSFKGQFKTAHWVSDIRAWVIKNHPQNRIKVERWVAAVEATDLLKTLRLAKEIEQNELDLLYVQHELAQLRDQIVRTRDLTAVLGEAKTALTEAKTTLENLRSEAARATDEADSARRSVMTHLEGVINFAAIQKAQAIMVRQGRLVGASAKEAYQAAQNIIAGERDKLAKAGFSSTGLNRLASANFNRQVRDDPSKVSLDTLLDLKSLPASEDSE